MNQNKVYLNTENVVVTSDILLINRTWRFNMDKINAVFVTRQANYRRYPIFIAIICLVVTIVAASIVAGAFSLLCIVIAYFMKTKYVLRVISHAGEIKPLISTNKQELEEIKQAIEIALSDNISPMPII